MLQRLRAASALAGYGYRLSCAGHVLPGSVMHCSIDADGEEAACCSAPSSVIQQELNAILLLTGAYVANIR